MILNYFSAYHGNRFSKDLSVNNSFKSNKSIRLTHYVFLSSYSGGNN